MQRKEPVAAGWPVHGWDWQADIRYGRRFLLERPLCGAQLKKDRDWRGRAA